MERGTHLFKDNRLADATLQSTVSLDPLRSPGEWIFAPPSVAQSVSVLQDFINDMPVWIRMESTRSTRSV